jgi:nitronate monooxygenase
MVTAALERGASAAFPALNYRTDADLRNAIREIKSYSSAPFGVNLIVNRSNPRYKTQLQTVLETKVPYVITSLGNPREVIEKCKPLGIKVFCDVVDLTYARKVESLGADALIAVNSMAGGHAGNIPPRQLITMLNDNCGLPVISAGGIGTGRQLCEVVEWGAAGASIGTIFIACEESDISPEYKQAMVDYTSKHIVKTNKLSGSPLTVINTPYVQQSGTRANLLEWILNHNRPLKKYVKMLIAYRGMKAVEKAAFGATYKNVWCAGPAIDHVTRILPIRAILDNLIAEYEQCAQRPPSE